MRLKKKMGNTVMIPEMLKGKNNEMRNKSSSDRSNNTIKTSMMTRMNKMSNRFNTRRKTYIEETREVEMEALLTIEKSLAKLILRQVKALMREIRISTSMINKV